MLNRPSRSLLPRSLPFAAVLAAAALVFGCGDPEGAPPNEAPDAASVAPDAGSGPDAGGTCNGTLPAADRARKLVVSHPYDDEEEDNHKANAYEVLELALDGKITSTGQTFEMGRATDGEIVFTPSGRIGIVVQDDGSLGVFRFADTGDLEVVDPAFDGGFYADRVVMDPSGERIYVVDHNWKENGGGIYEVKLGCYGKLSDVKKVVGSKLASTLDFLPGGKALLTAAEVLGSAAGGDVHLLDWGAEPALAASADAWGDDDAIISDARLTPDGRYLLMADASMFSDPHRLAAVEVTSGALRPAQTIAPVVDPACIVHSPFGNASLVLSGEGDDILHLTYDPSKESPFTLKGPLPRYQGGRPQLPLSAVMVQRGALKGRVLVAELMGVRQEQFEADGALTDLGLTALGEGYTAMTGAIGVQP